MVGVHPAPPGAGAGRGRGGGAHLAGRSQGGWSPTRGRRGQGARKGGTAERTWLLGSRPSHSQLCTRETDVMGQRCEWRQEEKGVGGVKSPGQGGREKSRARGLKPAMLPSYRSSRSMGQRASLGLVSVSIPAQVGRPLFSASLSAFLKSLALSVICCPPALGLGSALSA